MLGKIIKLFGTKSHRDIRSIQPILEEVNEHYRELSTLSHEDFRKKGIQLRKQVQASFQETTEEISKIQKEIQNLPSEEIKEKERRFIQIEEQEKILKKRIEESLNKALPEAFALVKETARRFTEHEEIHITATDSDKDFAQRHNAVNIVGETAVWKRKWKVAGQEIIWNMIPYDVQILGAIVMHQGKIAEMATGEGKTLSATLPAFLNSLTGKGVHIVTVNDYLSRRDSEWNAPLFAFHGLSVDCIDKYPPHTPERRKAYQADITYGTNNEFGFDYLRDNMCRGLGELVQRGHHFAIVDEVDSVLVDEARTPLIISGPVGKSDEKRFEELKPRVAALVEEQKKLCSNYLQEAKRRMKENGEAGLPLFRAHRGLPKYKPLIKYLSEVGIKQVLQKTENYYLADNQRHMKEADEPLFFTWEEKTNSIQLTEKGVEYLSKNEKDSSFFVLPDVSKSLDEIEKSAKSDEEIQKKKEEFLTDYKEKSERLHIIQQLLRAYTLYERDVEYMIADGKVKLVDEQTGRVLEGRRYSDGLHQALEAKEHVKIEEATQTYATITLQNYFRMYHKLSGMTGTAETEAGELWEIYKLDVVVTPPHRPLQREDHQDKVYKTMREKFHAVVEEIVKLKNQGRPVLVGTTSVEISELLSRMLKLRSIPHQVLNAKQHQREAEIIENAGKSASVTIATNMAGRGTDIKLNPESRKAGGLAIIGTERHESRRVDRQLRGRSGRQGDPGTSQFFVSLEDNLMRLFGSERMSKWMDRMGLGEGEVIQHAMITKSVERAQKKVEENHFGIRKRLLEYDNVMNTQRKVIYARRRHALSGEWLQWDIYHAFHEVAREWVDEVQSEPENESHHGKLINMTGTAIPIPKEKINTSSPSDLTQELFSTFSKFYEERKRKIQEALMPVFKHMQEAGEEHENRRVLVPVFDGKRGLEVMVKSEEVLATEGKSLIQEIEKQITLEVIDWEWKEHLREMDDLRQSVQNVVYEQKDPLLIYKFESFELFKELIRRLDQGVVSFLLKAALPLPQNGEFQEAQRRKQHRISPKLNESKPEIRGSKKRTATPKMPPPSPARSQRIIGRNDKVTVRYEDGETKKQVKFKRVEEDVKNNLCVVLEVHKG
ncbi:MAG: preprotein translocase subunit SecA [Cytophagales bacterium]|nr:preprotein translocase subunit SecA [Cytophagales bacterium]